MNKPTAGPHTDDTLLKETAVAIGGAAGKVAALAKSAKSVFVHPEAPAADSTPKKIGKLKAKNKTRLPRRQKKALAKKTALSA